MRFSLFLSIFMIMICLSLFVNGEKVLEEENIDSPLQCSQNGQPCNQDSDCCFSLCSPASCSNGICIGSWCKGRGSVCQADCECCSSDCVINEVSPGFCN